MIEEFVPYDQAVALKELGFDNPCFAVYEDKKLWIVENKNSMTYELCLKIDTFPAPTFSQAFRWFRERQYYSDITTGCTQIDGGIGFSWRIWKPWSIEEWSPEKSGEEWSYDTYEEAKIICLKAVIDIIKNE